MSSAVLDRWEIGEVLNGEQPCAAAEYPFVENLAAGVEEELDNEIARISSILEAEEVADIEDGVQHSHATLNRAVSFLRLQLDAYRLWLSKVAPVPDIDLGPNGSIDLHWKTSSHELLVNIPADSNAKATFYGDNEREDVVKGAFDPTKFDVRIAVWLESE